MTAKLARQKGPGSYPNAWTWTSIEERQNPREIICIWKQSLRLPLFVAFSSLFVRTRNSLLWNKKFVRDRVVKYKNKCTSSKRVLLVSLSCQVQIISDAQTIMFSFICCPFYKCKWMCDIQIAAFNDMLHTTWILCTFVLKWIILFFFLEFFIIFLIPLK